MLVEAVLGFAVSLAQEEAPGPPDGKFVRRNDDGVEVAKGEYRNGLPEGSWRFRYPDKTLRAKGRFEAGVPARKWTFFHPNGEDWAVGLFKDGQPSGKWEFTDPQGEPVAELSGEYGSHREVAADGTVLAEGGLLDGAPHGDWRIYWPDGSLQLEAELFRGRRVGAWRFWHAEGTHDPEFLTADHAPSPHGPGLAARVHALLAPEADAEPAELVAGLPDPSKLPPLPVPARLELDEDEARAYVQELHAASLEAVSLDLPVHADVFARHLDAGPALLPLVLEAMAGLDLTEPAGAKAASLLHETYLVEIAKGQSYGWRRSTAEEDVLANRWSLLRWYALTALTVENEWFWSFDVEIGARSLEDVAREGPRRLGLRPPVAIGPRAGESPDSKRSGRARPGTAARSIEKAEDAIAAGLDWLVRHQAADGSWSAVGFSQSCTGSRDSHCGGAGGILNDVGVTSLALLALQAAGNSQLEGPYSENVRRGLIWLLRAQDPEQGYIRAIKLIGKTDTKAGRWTYSHRFLLEHALATEAICGALGLQGSDVLRERAEQAVRYLLLGRNPYSAWRYAVPPDGSSDIVVSVFAASALRAARKAGVEVPQQAFEGLIAFVDEITDTRTGRTGYREWGEVNIRYEALNDHYPRELTEATTAAGLWVRLAVGQVPEGSPMMRKQVDLLLLRQPELEKTGFSSDFFYWMFASQALEAYAAFDAKPAKLWRESLQRALLDSQWVPGCARGSWAPDGPWGYEGGRVYATAAGVLALLAPVRHPPRR